MDEGRLVELREQLRRRVGEVNAWDLTDNGDLHGMLIELLNALLCHHDTMQATFGRKPDRELAHDA